MPADQRLDIGAGSRMRADRRLDIAATRSRVLADPRLDSGEEVAHAG